MRVSYSKWMQSYKYKTPNFTNRLGSTEGWVTWVLVFYIGEAINPIHVDYYLVGKIWS